MNISKFREQKLQEENFKEYEKVLSSAFWLQTLSLKIANHLVQKIFISPQSVSSWLGDLHVIEQFDEMAQICCP